MARGIAGPFRSERYAADSTISTKPAWLGTYTVTNTSGGVVTVTFYDDAVGGTGLPIEQVVLGNNQTQAIYPNGDTLNGLGVKSSNWTNVNVFVRWASR